MRIYDPKLRNMANALSLLSKELTFIFIFHSNFPNKNNVSYPEYYGDLVYKFKKIIGNPNFSDLFKRIVNRFKRAWYTLDIMQQTACLVFIPIMVETDG